MQLVKQKGTEAKMSKLKLKKSRSKKMSHKVDRLVNTPGASQRLVAASPPPGPQPTPTKKQKTKKRKLLLEQKVDKARDVVATQQQRLQVIREFMCIKDSIADPFSTGSVLFAASSGKYVHRSQVFFSKDAILKNRSSLCVNC